MASSKRKNSKKKQTPKPKLGVLDHLLSLFEQIVSYFEILFVYFRKKFNQSVRETVFVFLVIVYFLFLLFVGSSFLIHAGYLGIMLLTNQSSILSSLILGLSLFLLSILFIRYFLKKIFF